MMAETKSLSVGWLAAALLVACGNDPREPSATRWRASDDTFDGDLSRWEILNPTAAQLEVREGGLHVRPSRLTVWYQHRTALQLHQTVAGDFAVTASLRVADLAGGVPAHIWRLAGLQLRDPSTPAVHAYEGAFGSAAPWITHELIFLHKSTIADDTTMAHVVHPSGAGQIRLCRVGATVRAMYRGSSDDPWVVADERERPDLAGPLAAGPVAYDFNGQANFEAVFDDVTFAEIASMEGCMQAPAHPTDDDAPPDGGSTGDDATPSASSSSGAEVLDGDASSTSGESHGAESSGTQDDGAASTGVVAEEDASTGEAETGSDDTCAPEGCTLPLDGSASIVVAGDRYRFIGNSYMTRMNDHFEAVVAANAAVTVDTFPNTGAAASSSNGYDGWFFGAPLYEMDPVVDLIAGEGDVGACVFTSSVLDGGDTRTSEDDDEPLNGMRDFAEALTPLCDHIVLYLTWGSGASPTRNPNDYDRVIANTIADARTLEAEFPHLVTVPMALVFHDLMADPPLPVPRADYLHRPNNDPHQNMLGTVIIAWTFYAALADASPVGASYAYNDVFGPPFVVDDQIGLGGPTDPFGGGTGPTLPFDAATQRMFQQRIHDLVVQWRTTTTAFD